MAPRRIALITGVSRLNGIGRAICLELARKDMDIFFTYWTDYDKTMPWGIEKSEPNRILEEIQQLGVRCEKMELNLMDESAPQQLFREVQKLIGEPSILVNNATYSTNTPLTGLIPEELDKHYQVNQKAVTLLIAEFVKGFRQEEGRIINISSGQSLSAMNNELAYAMTKGAIEVLTRTLSHELAAKGITINAVNPGVTDTGWMSPKERSLFQDRSPKGRIGQPDDCARLVAFLASEEARWITGQVIHSEGGFMREKYD